MGRVLQTFVTGAFVSAKFQVFVACYSLLVLGVACSSLQSANLPPPEIEPEFRIENSCLEGITREGFYRVNSRQGSSCKAITERCFLGRWQGPDLDENCVEED